MKYNVIQLQDLIDIFKNDDLIQPILNTFGSIQQGKASDVEFFLHNRAIDFERRSISTTYLVFDEFKNLVGYFALANKHLVISKKNFDKLNQNLKRNFLKSGSKTSSEDYIVNSYLIGQIGKNYNLSKEHRISGEDLLTMAYNKLLEAKRIINARYVWLECEENDKIIGFYQTFGFKKIDKFKSKNGLVLMIMKLKKD